MRIGVPKEIKKDEYRVGLTPGSVREAVLHGHEVVVETNAAARIGISDADYVRAGARIADTADKETRTIKVNAELDNKSGRLRPQMFGRMRYVQGLAPALWIPEAAVVRIGDKDHVFLEETRGHFLLREVELGKRHDAGFSVAGGLKEGDRVVTRGAVYLKGVL